MRAARIVADLRVADVEAAKSFYTDFLGLRTEEFDMVWVARYTSPDAGVNVQLVTRDPRRRRSGPTEPGPPAAVPPRPAIAHRWRAARQ